MKIIKGRLSACPAHLRSLSVSGGWVVGSAAQWLVGAKHDTPKDFDVIVPFGCWFDASKMIPLGSVSNTFGGWKFSIEGRSYDVWPQELSDYILRTDSSFGLVAVQLHRQIAVVGTVGVSKEVP